jgi:hypothetical protein
VPVCVHVRWFVLVCVCACETLFAVEVYFEQARRGCGYI